ncbi:histidine kinase [Streptomyces formicae]|uniref:histidine kinase n=1 Tax=Streptomyces formicae TaxID=1616117 RepID=A0A291QFC9_9ACTN|nr:histidine kinase [Streptomyces formicae]ATL30411.1 putative two-component system sensor kinase [Streptomyces formicae]
MERIRNWLLPVLLAIQQLAFWPGRALRDGDPVGAVPLAAALGAAVAVTVALGVRRRHPAVAALAVEAVLLACLPLPEDAALLHSISVLVALYSVAVRCDDRRAALVGAVLTAAEAVRAAVQLGSAAEVGGEVLVTGALVLTVLGLGRGRRRWHAGRRAAARDLARAEAERGRAATTERQRLARELHDVSAHHLTSVVVTADAALRLGERKPELTAQALEFAADSGRETLASLHRLVAMMRTSAADEDSALEERVGELADGFARLGLRPAVEVAQGLAALTGPVADAAFGIVREALTNALRYAPGAAVRVRVAVADDEGAVDLTVEDGGACGDAAAGGAPAARQRLGSGRGTTGMRERAAALGGTLEAGPREDGPGWSVRARLPRGTAAPRGRVARHPALRGLDATDGATALAVAAFPVFAVLVERPSDVWLATGPVLAHALPLLWRRRAPWAALCAVLALTWLAPLGRAFGLLHPDVALCLLVSGGVAACVGVYAVGAYAGPARVTWPVPAVGAAGLALASIAVASADGIADLRTEGGFGLLLFLVCAVGLAFLFPLAALWAVGAAVRTRRERVRAYEDHALAATVHSAVVEAYEERCRIAEELRGEVLRHASDVITRAEAGDLGAVADGARAALSAMRDLLSTLRETTASATTPTPPGTPKETLPSPPTLPRARTAKSAPANGAPAKSGPAAARTVLEPSE